MPQIKPTEATDPSWDPCSIRARVIEILARLFDLPVADIPPSCSLEELGADSGDLIELQLMLLDAFGLELEEDDEPDEKQDASPTVDEVVQLVIDGVLGR